MTLFQPGQFWSVSNMPSSTSAGHFGHTVDIDLRYREQPVHGIVRTTEPDLSHYFCSSQLIPEGAGTVKTTAGCFFRLFASFLILAGASK